MEIFPCYRDGNKEAVTAKETLWHLLTLSFVGIVHFRLKNPTSLSWESLRIANTL